MLKRHVVIQKIQFKVATGTLRHLKINLTHNYVEKFKTLIKDINDDFYKLTFLASCWDDLNMVKISHTS